MMPEHLKGSTLHIVGPNDDYDEEEGSQDGLGAVDSEYEEMNVPEHVINKRMKIEEENREIEKKQGGGKQGHGAAGDGRA